MKLAAGLLAICWFFQAGPVAAEQPWTFEPLAPGSVVAVALADAEFVYTEHVWPGVVVAPGGWVLVSEKAVSERFHTAVVERAGQPVAAIDAEVVAILAPFHVALLHAPGLSHPAARLNARGAILREPVASYGWDDAICAVELCGAGSGEAVSREGRVLRRIDCPFEDETCWMDVHDAEIPAFGNGGPLVNSCGEVVGLNVVEPEHVPEELGGPVWYAVRLEEILVALEGLGVPFVAASEPCAVPAEGGGEGGGEGEGESEGGGDGESDGEDGDGEGESEGEEDGGDQDSEDDGGGEDGDGESAEEEDGEDGEDGDGDGGGEEGDGDSGGGTGDDSAGDGSDTLIPDREK